MCIQCGHACALSTNLYYTTHPTLFTHSKNSVKNNTCVLNWSILFHADSISDLIDFLLKEQGEAETGEGGKANSLTDTHIVQTLSDVFSGKCVLRIKV